MKMFGTAKPASSSTVGAMSICAAVVVSSAASIPFPWIMNGIQLTFENPPPFIVETPFSPRGNPWSAMMIT